MNSVYIAMSLDGYIADSNESVAWLDPYNEILAQSKGYYATRYESYYHDVDTVVMGYKTYETILSFGIDWPYAGKKTIVLSRKLKIEDPNISQVMTVEQFIQLEQNGKTWVVGGGSIVSQLISADAVDELIVTVMPVLIGAGIPLFTNAVSNQFTCTQSVLEDGVVELTYMKHK